MTPVRCRIPKAAIPALLLLASTLGAQAQWVEDSIEVETRWVGSLCYNPTANVVYGCGEQPGAFFAIDCSTNEVVTSIPLPNAWQVVHDSIDNKAYCIFYSTSDDDSILVVDGSTHTRIGVIPLYWATFLVWDPVANRLYVSEFEDNSVAVIDCATDTVIAHIPTSSEPLRMHLNTRHRKLYVQCQGSDRLNVVDLNTLEVIESIRLPGMPEAGCYSEAVDKYYCGAGVEVVVVDGSSDTVVGSIALSRTHPTSAVSVEPHSIVMVGGYTGGIDSVYVIDAAGDSVMRVFSGLRRPSYLHWSAPTDLVYCSNTHWMANQVTVITGNGSGIQDVLQVGESPSCYAAAPRHRRLYVACTKVYVIRDTVAGIEEGGYAGSARPVHRAWPNPFEGTVKLVAEWNDDPLAVAVYSADGRLVRMLEREDVVGIGVSFEWDGRDNDGKEVPAGVYIAVAEDESLRSGVRMVKMR